MDQDFKLGPWVVQPSLNSVARNGNSVRLEPKAMEVLVCLAQAGGEVVSKEKLIADVWADTPFVGDDVLTRNISALRQALEDDAKAPRVIETIPKKGYRLLAKVEPVREPPGGLPPKFLLGILAAAIAIPVVLAVRWAIPKIFPPPPISIKRLTTSGRVEHAAISRDGKYLAYSEDHGNAQSLWVREIATATSVQLLPLAQVDYKSLAFSPNGDYVYYTRKAPGTSSQLFRIPAFGRTPQKLLEDVLGKFSLSPDGKSLTFVRRDSERQESALIVAAIDGAGEKVLATRHLPISLNWEAGASWSTDGKLIAAVEVEPTPDLQCRLLVIAAENGAEKMSSPPALQYCVGGQPQWLSNGHGLIAPFQKPHLQLWEFSYPQFAARRINHDPMRYPEVRLSSDSHSLVAVQGDMPSSIWVGPANEPDRVNSVKRGHFLANFGLGWMPSGEILFWTSGADTHDFVQMRSDGTDERILPFAAGIEMWPEVCPDGRILLFNQFYRGILTLMRSDLSGFKPQPLATGMGESSPRCSPDSKWAVYVGSGKLWKIPVSGGPSILLADKPCESPSISHDGQLVACGSWSEGASSPKLTILSFSGSSAVKTIDLPDTTCTERLGSRSWLRWTPDDRALAFIDIRTGVENLWVQPLAGGPPHALTHFSSEGVMDFDWSRDGKQIAIARGDWTSDAVMITNF